MYLSLRNFHVLSEETFDFVYSDIMTRVLGKPALFYVKGKLFCFCFSLSDI